jgi:hypothetical protein
MTCLNRERRLLAALRAMSFPTGTRSGPTLSAADDDLALTMLDSR